MFAALNPINSNQIKSYQDLALYLDWDTAEGNASSDTIATYTSQLKLYFEWCEYNRIHPLGATVDTIKAYRHYLRNKKKYKVKTIALKLTVVRKLYATLCEREIIASNPAINVKSPTERRDETDHDNYLELEEARDLIASLPTENTVRGLRDRLLVVLMLVQGCRQIGLYRLNLGDIIRRGSKVGLRIRAKGSVRVVPLKADVAAILERYLQARKATGEKLRKGTPVFISLARNSSGNRLTRRSMQRIVNDYLEQAALKDSESRTITTHGLRHTVGYLLTLAGLPLRVIQKFLGHSDPRTTAIYAHVASLWKDNPAISIQLAV